MSTKKAFNKNEVNVNNITSQYILSTFLSKLKKIKEYESKTIYFFILLLGFAFYTLAYVFFYGYYFSGKSDNIQSILQVMINPVPFNFKSLIVLGIFFVLIVFIFVFMTIKLIDSITKATKFYIISDMIFFIILFIFLNMFFTIVFVGQPDFKVEYFKVWLFPMYIIVFLAFICASKVENLFYGFIGSINIMVLLVFWDIIFKLNMNTNMHTYICLTSGLFLPIILVLSNFKDIIININVSIFLYSIIASYFNLSNIWGFKSEIILIFSVVISVSSRGLIRKYKMKYCSKKRRTYGKKYKKSEYKFFIMINLVISRFKYILIPISILGIITYTYYIVYFLGYAMSNNLSQFSYDEITYYSNGNKKYKNNYETIKGIVVSHKDNVYYISNQDKELITIKNFIVKTKPLKE